MSTDLVGATPFGETGWAEDHGVTDGRRVVVDDDQQTPFSCTVVVVMYNSADVVAGCLRSLPSALWGLDAVEVIVVDNLSTDDSVAVAEKASVHVASGINAAQFRVVSLPDNRGYAAAINAGIAAAQPSDTVLVLNPDIRLEPGSVVHLLGGLEHPGTGIVVPRLLDGDGVCQPSLRRRPTAGRALAEAVLGGPRASAVGQWGETITDADRYDRAGIADWATGAAMLISRQCLDDVGPLDESFFLYSEETDFMLGAGDAGYETRLVPDAVATHLGGELERSPELWSLRAVNRVRLQRRRSGRMATLGFLAASVLGEGVRAGAGRSTSRQAVADLARRGPGIVLRRPPARQPAVPGWICFSAQDWWYHNQAHSDFQLLRRVAERRPVLLVNSIGLRVPLPGRSTGPGRRVMRKVRSVARGVRRPDATTPGFRVMTPLPLPLYSSATARRVNAWLVRQQVRMAARAVGVTGPDRRDPVIVVTIPTAIDAAQRMPHAALVVNRSDKHSTFPEADGEAIRALELSCLEAADLVFYSSRSLLLEESPLTGNRARLLDHGVDAEHFKRDESLIVPADLASIPGPKIGFFGALDDYLVDFDLLEKLATELPDAQVVLIGDATCSMRRFDRHPNVHHLTFRPYELIPAYGSGFDVALMPWLDNEWIHHSNPIKLKEYLALGLPIVSTDFPESHRYEGLLRIASTADDFVEAVAATLADGGVGTPATRRAAVAHATWDRTARQLLYQAESVIAVPAQEIDLR